jgi:hypothetical protein
MLGDFGGRNARDQGQHVRGAERGAALMCAKQSDEALDVW